MNLYDILGVSPDADDKEIKKAYRKEAQNTHPDRESGDGDKFQLVAKAYNILSDKDRRDEYDRTGNTEEGPDQRTIAESKLAHLFEGLINSESFEGNLIDNCRQKVLEILRNIDNTGSTVRGKLKKLQKQKGRIVADDHNMYDQILGNSIKALENDLRRLDKEREITSEVQALLERYEDSNPEIIIPDPRQAAFATTFSRPGTTW